MDLGRDKPTLLITNNTQESPELLLTRYAKRMLIENALAHHCRWSPATV